MYPDERLLRLDTADRAARLTAAWGRRPRPDDGTPRPGAAVPGRIGTDRVRSRVARPAVRRRRWSLPGSGAWPVVR